MELTDFARALRRFWPLSLAVFVVTLGVGYVAATASGPSYSSTAVLAVTPNAAEPNGAHQVGFEIPRIVEQMGARATRDQLPAEIRAELTSLTAERDVEPGIVRVKADGEDAAAVATAANAAAEAVVADYQPFDADPLTPATRGDVVNVEVIDAAVPDGGSGMDALVPIMLATVVLAAIFAAVAAVMAQRFSQARDLESRIRSEIGVPVLAVVPATRELSGDGDVDMRELLRNGPAPLIEAFQTLRSRSEVLLPSTEAAVAVSSWQRREGRTTVTAALGQMLSAVGESCVVIDASLRKPDLTARLAEPGARGLAEYAADRDRPLLRPTDQPQLQIVPAGIAEAHPAEILTVALPAALDEAWRQSAQTIVLIDGPPIGPVLKGAVRRTAETATVLGVVPRLLLVIDASTKNLDEIAVSVERLQEDGVTVIGAVVNRRRGRRRWDRRPEPSPPTSRRSAPVIDVAVPQKV